MDITGAEILSHRLQNTAAYEQVVKHGEEDEQPVEDARHLLGAENRDRNAVDDEAGETDEDFDDALQPPRKLRVVQVQVLAVLAAAAQRCVVIGHFGLFS